MPVSMHNGIVHAGRSRIRRGVAFSVRGALFLARWKRALTESRAAHGLLRREGI